MLNYIDTKCSFDIFFYIYRIVDIYIVADEQEKQYAMKLHRYSICMSMNVKLILSTMKKGQIFSSFMHAHA